MVAVGFGQTRRLRRPMPSRVESTNPVSIWQQSVVSSAMWHSLDSTPMQFRLNLPSRGIRGGSHERIQYADVEAKKAANSNDEAEGAQTEIHRSFANEGAEPTGPRPCRFRAAVVWYVRLSVAGYAVDAGRGHCQSRGGVRIQALAIFTIGAASVVPAAAQTYDQAYPVCLQAYGPSGNNIDCSYTSLPHTSSWTTFFLTISWARSPDVLGGLLARRHRGWRCRRAYRADSSYLSFS